MINYYNIQTFVHEYDFPIYEKVLPFKEDIISQYYKNIKLSTGYTTLYINDYLEKLIIPKFIELIVKNYNVDKLINHPKLWTYVQDNLNFNSVLHHHIPTSTLNAVFYIDPPQNEGGIQFLLGEEYHTLHPQTNKLYVFPNWLYHKPLSQESKIPRICFNLEYLCKQRPIHKKTKIIF